MKYLLTWKAFQTDSALSFIISSEKISKLSVISIFLHSLHGAWNAWRQNKTQLCVKKLIKTCFYEARKVFSKENSQIHLQMHQQRFTSISLFFWRASNGGAIRSMQLIFPQKIPILNVFKLIQGSIIFIKNSESEKQSRKCYLTGMRKESIMKRG